MPLCVLCVCVCVCAYVCVRVCVCVCPQGALAITFGLMVDPLLGWVHPLSRVHRPRHPCSHSSAPPPQTSTHTHTYIYTLTRTLAHTHTLAHSLTHTHTHTRNALTLTHSHSLSHTRTHTHDLQLGPLVDAPRGPRDLSWLRLQAIRGPTTKAPARGECVLRSWLDRTHREREKGGGGGRERERMCV